MFLTKNVINLFCLIVEPFIFSYPYCFKFVNIFIKEKHTKTHKKLVSNLEQPKQ